MKNPLGHHTSLLITNAPSHAKQVEDMLAELQDNHRLAIHVAEEATPHPKSEYFRFPQKTWKTLGQNHAQVTQATKRGDEQLLSMSLLGSQTCSLPVRPYDARVHGFPVAPIYAIDLRQDTPNRPYIPCMSALPIDSGHDVRNKIIDDLAHNDVPELEEMRFAELPDLVHASLQDAHASKTAQQLDGLGRHIEERKGQSPQTYNELLVATGVERVRALMIPVWIAGDNERARTPAHYQEALALSAAITGLQHLQKGIDVPVMFYPMGGEDKGKPRYVGQGQAELRAVAIEALQGLQHAAREAGQAFDAYMRNEIASGEKEPVKALMRALQKTPGLKLNPHKPVETQLTATDKLTQQAQHTEERERTI